MNRRRQIFQSPGDNALNDLRRPCRGIRDLHYIKVVVVVRHARNASSPADVSPTSFKALRCCCCLLVLLPPLHSESSIHYGCLNILLSFLSYDCGILPRLLAGAQQCNLQNRLTAHTYIQTLSSLSSAIFFLQANL